MAVRYGRFTRRIQRWVCPVGALVLTLLSAAVHADDDIEVCNVSYDVEDPEFSPDGRQLAYFNFKGELRVVDLDDDGLPPGGAGGDCSGTLVATGVLWKVPNLSFRQGPEWGSSERGIDLFYTAALPEGQPALARAWSDAAGWHTELLDNGASRGLPMASVDASDPQPRIMYLRAITARRYVAAWREANSVSEQVFPASGNLDTGGVPRWVRGARQVTTARADSAGIFQGAYYDLDTRQTSFITNGGGQKDEIWMWRAPDFGGDRVAIDVVDGTALQVWHEGPSGWTLINTIAAADITSLPLIYSPEPFVVRGRSYVAVQLGQKKFDNSQIWAIAIDPVQSLALRASNSGIEATRGEPEWLATTNGVYVYYSEYDKPLKASLRRGRVDLP